MILIVINYYSHDKVYVVYHLCCPNNKYKINSIVALCSFTESLYKNMGILPSKFQEISPVNRRIIRSSITGICSKH